MKRYERHGHTNARKRSAEHYAWTNMIQRCTNAKRRDYAQYGGRGIKVCAKWRESFAAFLVDVGERPSAGHSLDRFPNMNGDYEPGNVRWATKHEQMQNTRATRLIEFNGERNGVAEWARRIGLDCASLCGRLERGWSVEKALTTLPRMQAKRVYGIAKQAQKHGLKYATVRARLHRGWTLSKALTTGVTK